MGNDQRIFSHQIDLISNADLQIRDNSIESARLTANRLLERKLTKSGFKMKILIYPHHTLRENPLASGAGADRMSTGMSHSFGKVIGIAAQVRKGKTLMRLWVDKEHLAVGRLAMKRSQMKFPCNCKIVVVENAKAVAGKKVETANKTTKPAKGVESTKEVTATKSEAAVGTKEQAPAEKVATKEQPSSTA